MRNTQTGFTLIELLVVIAIIGILASVVLASLNTARDKGADAAVKSNINNMRAQAEIYYDDNNRSYDVFCNTPGSASGATELLDAAKSAWGGSPTVRADGTASSWDTEQCHDSGTAWVAIAPTRKSVSGTPIYWCTDSTGRSGEVASDLLANSMSCP